MKAWLLNNFSGIENLQLGETPDPVAGPGEALLEVYFAALNPADRYLAEGHYPAKPTLPHILGRDLVGRVIALAPEVTGIQPGDMRVALRSEVGVTRPGTFAQLVSVPAESLAEVPAGWSLEEAAAGPLVYLTAWQALTQWGELSPSVVLITGASGGVGSAALQLAKALGHQVIALSRSAEKRDQLKLMGASVALDPADPQWISTARKALEGKRVDLAIDNIGGPLFNQVVDSLGDRGKISAVGRLAGPVPDFNTASLFFRRARIGGVAVGAYTAAESQLAWRDLLLVMNRTGAKPLIDHLFPFSELPRAFERLAHGPMGKVLIDVRNV